MGMTRGRKLKKIKNEKENKERNMGNKKPRVQEKFVL